MDDIMTVDEVSEYLHICKKTVYHLAKQGALPVTHVGSNLRFYRSDIDQVLKNFSSTMKYFLIVDDAPAVCTTIKKIVEDKGHIAMTATKGMDCLDILKDIRFDRIFLDLMLEDMKGLEVVQQIRLIDKLVPITIITACSDIDIIKEVMQYDVSHVIMKPFNINEIAREIGA